jgi:hypothetical protein
VARLVGEPVVTGVATAAPTTDRALAVHPRLDDAFRALDAAGVAWAVLRGLDRLADPEGDVDLLVAADAGDAVVAALAAARFGELPAAGRGSHRFFLGLDRSGGWLKLDVVDDLAFGRWAETDSGIAAACLARRTRSGGSPWRLADEDAAWAELLHLLLDPGHWTRERTRRLGAVAARASDLPLDGPVVAWLRRVDPAAPAALLAAIRASASGAARANAKAVRRAAIRRDPLGAALRLGRTVVRRRLSRAPLPIGRRGMVVALLGPDGAGKSSVARRLSVLSPLPVRTFYLGAYPQSEGMTDGPSKVPGLRFLRRLGRLAGRGLAARLHAWRGGLAVLDRHPLETLLDGRGNLRRRLLARSVSRPDLFVVLDAPAALIHERKGEWPVDTIEHQLAGYRRLASRPDVRRVDGSGSIEAVALAAMTAVWEIFIRRGLQAERQSRGPGR